MKKYLPFLFTLLIFTCTNDDDGQAPSTPTSLSSFIIKADQNPSLTDDVIFTFDGINTYTATINYICNIENLKATYAYNADEIKVNDITQLSGVTQNNFSKIVEYKLYDNLSETYTSYYIKIKYFTGLPIIVIDTNNITIESKEDYIDGFVSVNGGLEFEDLQNVEMKIRGRGNSTWFLHPKKPYQLKYGDKTPMLNMPQDKKWLFLAEYSDKSLIRNKISLDFGHMSNLDWTPSAEYAEVFLNHEYNGTYLITQKVEVKSNRLNLPDNGYLIEIDQDDRIDVDDVFFQPTIFTQNYPTNVFNIKEPSIAFNSPEYNLIEDHINAFESVLFGSNFQDPVNGYKAYIDLPSFIDWYIIQEISKTVDSQWYSSIYFNYIPGEKIKMGPLWDFDLSYGNVDYADATYAEGFWVKDNPWYSRMFEDPDFENQVKDRFMYFYNNLDVILNKIDDYQIYLEQAQVENYQKWDTLGTYVWPNPVYYNTHLEEVIHLKTWLNTRMNWMYNQFN